MGLMIELDDNIKNKGVLCSFCDDKKPSAFWYGSKYIYVCENCALHVLPHLIADAVNLRGSNDSAFAAKTKVPKILKNFWRGIALRILRQQDNEKK